MELQSLATPRKGKHVLGAGGEEEEKEEEWLWCQTCAARALHLLLPLLLAFRH